MTPVVPAMPTAAGASPAPRGARAPAAADDGFARALARRQPAAPAGEGEGGDAAPAQRPAPEQATPDETAPEAPYGAAIAPTAPAQPQWPPPGLAALGLAEPPAAAAAPPGGEAPVVPAPRPAAPPGAPAAGALPTAGALAMPAAAAAVAEPEPDLAAPAAEAAPPADTGDAEPPSFALPSLPAPVAPREAAAPPAAPLPPAEVGADDFGERVGAQLHWAAERGIGHARIRVSPQDLGPVEVRLRLDGDRLSADFVAAQPEVRQALEQQLPRLRELLGEQGFVLAHADVGGQGAQRDGPMADADAPARHDAAGAADIASATAPAGARAPRRGLLDAYA
ncbi:flagellar hook-length control protein FliK [Luteimonas huabeiensis]|uniref:flagellar hook-length control protein FliK n=1 Tax=Luteimonas huabeiensis TaxID=1244513 RepID=UPI000466DB82|nr:flagellar hook-length control protein FliK [Luteimonas huabeiensis]